MAEDSNNSSPNIKQKLTNKVGSFFNSAKRWFKITKLKINFWLINIYRIIRRQTNTEWTKRVIITVGTIVLAGFLVYKGTGQHVTPDLWSSFFITLGSMIGGVIAIVFTLSIFAIQNTATLYSARYLEVYSRNKVEWSIYVIIVSLTSLFFAAGIYTGQKDITLSIATNNYLIFGSLLTVGIIFILVDWQYYGIKEKTNPRKGLVLMKKRVERMLEQTHKDMVLLSKMIQIQQKEEVSDNQALAASYYHYSGPRLNSISQYLEHLFEIAVRQSDKHELLSAKEYLNTVAYILGKYLTIRNESSLQFLSSIGFMVYESDSNTFLRDNLERYIKTGEHLIAHNEQNTAAYICTIFNYLASESSDIGYVGNNRTNENSIYMQIVGYYKQYIKVAIDKQADDVLISASGTFTNIAQTIITKHYSAEMLGWLDTIATVSLYGAAKKLTYLPNQGIDALLYIINQSLDQDYPDHTFNETLEKIKYIVVFLYALYKGGSDFFATITINKPFQDLTNILLSKANAYLNDKYTAEQKRIYESNLLKFSEELRRFLRQLADEVKDADTYYSESVGELIYKFIWILAEVKYKNASDKQYAAKIDNEIKWYLFLPTWFPNNSKTVTGETQFMTYMEPIVKASIKLLQKEENALVSKGIRAAYDLISISFERIKGVSGVGEIRLMKNICLLGILALKLGHTDIFNQVKELIGNFERKYVEKRVNEIPKGVNVGELSKDQLENELVQFRYDLEWEDDRYDFLKENAAALAKSEITVEDIDRFTYQIWNTVCEHSSILDEIKKDAIKNNRIEGMKLVSIRRSIF